MQAEAQYLRCARYTVGWLPQAAATLYGAFDTAATPGHAVLPLLQQCAQLLLSDDPHCAAWRADMSAWHSPPR